MYADDFELGPERPRYPKAAPMLAFSARVAAYKYSKHIERFRKKFANLCITRFKNERPHYSLMCARIGDEYFVIQVHCAKHHVAPPQQFGAYGQIQFLSSAPSRLTIKAELFYADDKKLYEKYRAFRTAILAYGGAKIVGLGETFYCRDINMVITPYGSKADIDLIYPYDEQHKVHDRLRAAEKARKPAFAKYVSAEKRTAPPRSLLEDTWQYLLTKKLAGN